MRKLVCVAQESGLSLIALKQGRTSQTHRVGHKLIHLFGHFSFGTKTLFWNKLHLATAPTYYAPKVGSQSQLGEGV